MGWFKKKNKNDEKQIVTKDEQPNQFKDEKSEYMPIDKYLKIHGKRLERDGRDAVSRRQNQKEKASKKLIKVYRKEPVCKNERNKSLSEYMGSKTAKKKMGAYDIPGVDEAEYIDEEQ